MAKKSKQKGRGGDASKGPSTGRGKPTTIAAGKGGGRNGDKQAAHAPVDDVVGHDAAIAAAPEPMVDATSTDATPLADDALATHAAGADAIHSAAPETPVESRVDTSPDADAASPAPAFTAVPAPAIDLTPVDVVDSGVGNPDDIRGVLIQLAKARLLLPNATIAEVLSYAEPDAIEGGPDWLLGRIRWRGWQLPLIAFSQMAGISDERGGLGSKVVVLKALAGGKTPYFAVLTQGFPRLVTVSRGALVVDESAADLPDMLIARVTLNQDDAYLPDLARVEALIGQALANAA